MWTVVSSISCPHGIYATLGNHDPCAIAPALERIGMRILVNDSVTLTGKSNSLQVLGIDDTYDYRCADLPTALDGVPADRFKILLAHTPDSYAEAADANVRLYLCGHTHAGQVRFPSLGALVSNSDAPKSYTSGLWKHGQMTGYTSSGVGCSMLPIRFGCPPEIAVITLRRSLR
jgi:predicted MPP superfamily phosphohydrolase